MAVTPEQVAIHAGLPLPVSEEALPVVAEAIASAYRAATAYLGRPAQPGTFTQRGAVAGPDGWVLDQDPVVEVVSATAEVDPVGGYPTGRWTIVYRAGLDPDADSAYGAALTEFVIAAAAASQPVARLARQVAGNRVIKSVSVEGQSVTYADDSTTARAGSGGSGAAGAPPALDSLEPWQRIAISQRPGIGPHPARTGAAWWL